MFLFQKLKKNYKSNPSEKLHTQLQEKEKTLKILEAQVRRNEVLHGKTLSGMANSVDPDQTAPSGAV